MTDIERIRDELETLLHRMEANGDGDMISPATAARLVNLLAFVRRCAEREATR